MALRKIIPIDKDQKYDLTYRKPYKKRKHIPYSKESIEQDIKDHATGGARYCCLNANIIFQPECANHRWH